MNKHFQENWVGIELTESEKTSLKERLKQTVMPILGSNTSPKVVEEISDKIVSAAYLYLGSVRAESQTNSVTEARRAPTQIRLWLKSLHSSSNTLCNVRENKNGSSVELDLVFSKLVNDEPYLSTVVEVIKRIGFKGELVSHGLRALASTMLNEQRFNAELIEVCLAHVDKNTFRNAYNRSDYLERRRVIMAWWSEHIEKASTGVI